MRRFVPSWRAGDPLTEGALNRHADQVNRSANQSRPGADMGPWSADAPDVPAAPVLLRAVADIVPSSYGAATSVLGGAEPPGALQRWSDEQNRFVDAPGAWLYVEPACGLPIKAGDVFWAFAARTQGGGGKRYVPLRQPETDVLLPT